MPTASAPNRLTSRWFTLPLLTMILSGCAADWSGPLIDTRGESPPTGEWQRVTTDSAQKIDIRYFGFIDVTQDIDGEAQYFEAGFAQFSETAPIQVLLNSFSQAGPDSCDYRQKKRGDSTPLVFPDELALPGYPCTFVDAGNRINVSIGSRSNARLKRTSTRPEDAVQYETDVGSLPLSIGGFKLGDALLKTRGLVVSSAGGTFPAFSNIAFPQQMPSPDFGRGLTSRSTPILVFNGVRQTVSMILTRGCRSKQGAVAEPVLCRCGRRCV